MLKVFILLCILAYVRTQELSNYNYPFVDELDQAREFVLRWDFNSSHIQFEITVNTVGWVALGISDQGLMYPSDVFIGYVSGTDVYAGDFHTVGYFQPVYDASQDWHVQYGYEENGKTILSFLRELETCDTQDDKIITNETLRLIYAYHTSDPTTSLMGLTKHTKKGSKSISLLTSTRPPAALPADAKAIELKNENYVVPSGEQTTFHCTVFDLSVITTKSHIIRIEPIIATGGELVVEHMILYRCHLRNVQIVTGSGYNCFTDAPQHVQFCKSYVASFGHGASTFNMPSNIGLPAGGADQPNIYVLAIHYDNAAFKPGILDNSGIRITYTAQLRRHDGAFLTLGTIISPNWAQFIPPGEPSFVQRAYCSQNCLNWGFSGSPQQSAMNIVGTIYHSHVLGRTMKLRHLSPATQGYTENPWIDYDPTYAYEKQEFRQLKTPKTIQPNDMLSLECTYNTSAASTFTVGGWESYKELCRAYTLYYPANAVNLEGCMTWSSYSALRYQGGVQVMNETQIFLELLRTDWSSPRGNVVRRSLRRSLDTSIEYDQCWSSDRSPSYAFGYLNHPQISRPWRPLPGNQSGQRQSRCPVPAPGPWGR